MDREILSSEAEKEIAEILGMEELLCQLAEECAELSKAALKLRRVITGKNPTPKTREECIADLAEEYADTDLVNRMVWSLIRDPACTMEAARVQQARKTARWKGRLDAREVTT